MFRFLFVCFVFLVVEKSYCINSKNNTQEDTLVAVVTLFRHGDRAPSKSFPNDPYFKEEYWPMGFGELTNVGKLRMYELGKWFRKRYSSFLSEEYSPDDIYIRSTNPSRCLMSAYAVLAGLFPPKGPQMFNKDLLWQPIPVHTMPIDSDEVLSMTKECPRYTNLTNLLKTKGKFPVNHSNRFSYRFEQFFSSFLKNSGWNTTDISNVATLQTNLDIYTSYNSSFIPPWAKLLDQNMLVYVAGVSHQQYSTTTEQKRLLTGPFWTNFFSHFDNVINNSTDTPKFLMLSAHDTTIVSLLNCMDAYDSEPPGFGATLIWELRRRQDESHYINLFYKKPYCNCEPSLLSLSKCEVDCNYKCFKEMLSSVTVAGEKWERECRDGTTPSSKPPKRPFFT